MIVRPEMIYSEKAKPIYDDLVSRRLLCLFSIRGSQLYGTCVEGSDYDYHGLFMYPDREWAKLSIPVDRYADEKEDTVVYEMKKAIGMLSGGDPGLIEMLFAPENFNVYRNEVAEKLIKNRDLFITKRCFLSFSQYAKNQIIKAVGKNKKVHRKKDLLHPEGIEKLKKLLFDGAISSSWIELRFSRYFLEFLLKKIKAPVTEKTSFKEMDQFLEDDDIKKLLPPKRTDFCYILQEKGNFPMRPVRLVETGIDLTHYNCSSLEHVGHVYRLYFYGDKANGVFKGGDIICSSIPVEDEKPKFSSILIDSVNEYESAKSDWRSFFEWMAQRNEKRWEDGDSKSFQFDAKNMQHTVRLLLSGENIARNGEPIVRFSGKDLVFLREIREGKYAYDYLMKYANDKIAGLKEVYEKSSLPDSCNMVEVDSLYNQLVDINSLL